MLLTDELTSVLLLLIWYRQVYSPCSPPLTGPTVKTPGWGSELDTWIPACACGITDVTPVPSAVLSKRKVTGFLLELDWD